MITLQFSEIFPGFYFCERSNNFENNFAADVDALTEDERPHVERFNNCQILSYSTCNRLGKIKQ